MAVRRLKDRLRNRFNVSVSELDHQALWQRARVGVVSIGSDAGYIEQQLNLALREAERILPDCMIDGDIQLL